MNARTLIDNTFTDRAIWSRILSEASQASAQDRFLALVVAERVTEHHNLTDAIIASIATLLSPPLPSNKLLAELRTLLDEDCTILAGAGCDMAAVLERDPATAKAFHVLLHAKGFLALQIHRFAHTLWKAGRREFALYLQGCASRVLQVDIHPAAQLGIGIFFDHATGIVIGETSVVEDNVSILQNVTLGGTGKEGNDIPRSGTAC